MVHSPTLIYNLLLSPEIAKDKTTVIYISHVPLPGRLCRREGCGCGHPYESCCHSRISDGIDVRRSRKHQPREINGASF